MRSKTRHSRAGPNMNNVYTRPTQSAANEPAPKPVVCGRAASRTWRRNRPNSASSPSPKSLNWKGLRARQLDKTLLALGGTPLGSPTAVFTVSGSHTYAEEGTYTVTTTIAHLGDST